MDSKWTQNSICNWEMKELNKRTERKAWRKCSRLYWSPEVKLNFQELLLIEGAISCKKWSTLRNLRRPIGLHLFITFVISLFCQCLSVMCNNKHIGFIDLSFERHCLITGLNLTFTSLTWNLETPRISYTKFADFYEIHVF